MPKKKTPKKLAPYRQKPPSPAEHSDTPAHGRAAVPRRRQEKIGAPAAQQHARVVQPTTTHDADFTHAKPIPASHFKLREDGSVENLNLKPETLGPQGESPDLVFRSENPFVRLYHGNCLELLDAIAAKYEHGRFDAIFADPPYFLSNGGITCHAG